MVERDTVNAHVGREGRRNLEDTDHGQGPGVAVQSGYALRTDHHSCGRYRVIRC